MMTLKKHLLRKSLCILMIAACASHAKADDLIQTNGKWKITYFSSSHAFRIGWQKPEGTYLSVISNSLPAATYDKADKTVRNISSASFAEMNFSADSIHDEFGAGISYSYSFNTPDNGDRVSMIFKLNAYDVHEDYLIASLTLDGEDCAASNFLSPVSVETSYNLFLSNGNNRMIKVPYDNDGFGRYQRYKLNTTMTSYEVATLFEGESRRGLVLGAVDHNHWKNAVTVTGSDNGKVDFLQLFSGVSTSETRDILPHGKLQGPTISSARMLIGFYEDWRTGMEDFAHANTLVQPKRDSWTHGTPFGWQSWGVMAEMNSYETDLEIFDYYRDVLVPGGFCNEQGHVIFSLDASDGFDDGERVTFNKHAAETDQYVGRYGTPFSCWWGESELDRYFYTAPDGTNYKLRDVILHVNGEPYKYDGAYCMDPTHPATKRDISSFIRGCAVSGYHYVKLDFVNCGMIQADHYYNPNVTTAVEAYNEGMNYLRKQADKYDIFVALSISPLFPYQYANSRRIACDSWALIGWSEYSMNAISSGWWTDQIYQFNDPDHLVLVGKGDQADATIGENRARLTNGAATGMMLMADNFSYSDATGRGDAALSRARAQKLLFNKDVIAMGRLGRSFRPVYGYKEYNGKPKGAESFFMHHTDDYLYVAIINYTASELSGTIPYELLDITKGEVNEIKELWTATTTSPSMASMLDYSVPPKDARIYRLSKKPSSVNEWTPVSPVTLTLQDGSLQVESERPMSLLTVYDAQGRLFQQTEADGRRQLTIPVHAQRGVLVVKTRLADGEEFTQKVNL